MHTNVDIPMLPVDISVISVHNRARHAFFPTIAYVVRIPLERFLNSRAHTRCAMTPISRYRSALHRPQFHSLYYYYYCRPTYPVWSRVAQRWLYPQPCVRGLHQ